MAIEGNRRYLARDPIAIGSIAATPAGNPIGVNSESFREDAQVAATLLAIPW